MQPTAELMREHEAIKVMLAVLEKISDRLEAGEDIDPGQLGAIVDFIRVFADACHHGKEEDYLFVAMEEAGIPRQGGPLGVMLQEHELGRTFVAGLDEAVGRYAGGDRSAVPEIVENARNYAGLLLSHIDREDSVLYPMADSNLSEESQSQLSKDFARVESERIGPGKHEEYHKFLKELKAQYLE